MNANTVKILGVEVRYLRPPASRESRDRQARHVKLYAGGMEKLETLLDRICWDAEIDIATVRGRNNVRRIVDVRRTFARRAVQLGYSSVMIGAALHRHHTSVLSLLK